MNNWKLIGNDIEMDVFLPSVVQKELEKNGLLVNPLYGENEKKVQWVDKLDWTYQTSFIIEKEKINKKFILKLEKVDTIADVILNGETIHKCENMFLDYYIDITGKVLEENDLEIVIKSPIKHVEKMIAEVGFNYPAINDTSELGGIGENKCSVFLRKTPCSFGWDWGPRVVTLGINGNVSLICLENYEIVNNCYRTKKIEGGYNVEVTSEIYSKNSGLQKVAFKIMEKEFSFEINLEEGYNKFNVEFFVENPKEWNPNTLGKPNLYEIIMQIGNIIDTKKIGFRTIKLIRKPDEKGISMYFEVNGVPLFMKGANHIPNDIYHTSVTRNVYEKEIESAIKANLNMIRVWGGGYYENDDFYELCNEKGILVWQDFMFACSMYPVNNDMRLNLTREVQFISNRLDSNPCIALYCGNNEIFQAWEPNMEERGWWWRQLYSDENKALIQSEYFEIFSSIIPSALKESNSNIEYWESSPWTGNNNVSIENENNIGDSHYWGVWHMKEDYNSFYKNVSRFVSEYGMQSFPSLEVLEDFCPIDQLGVTSNVMTHRQKSGIGNELILHYVNNYLVDPKDDFEKFVTYSQINQGIAFENAISAHKFNRPYCMGTLYWQLNDIWAGPSWSTLNTDMSWKASHYFVKRACEKLTIISKIDDLFINLVASSDIGNDIDVNVKVEVFDIHGSLRFDDEMELVIPKHGNMFIGKYNIENLNRKDSKNFYTKVTLKNSEFEISKVILHNKFETYKFRKPEIKWSVTNNELVINSNEFIPFIQIKGRGLYSDNFFNVEPNTKYVVYLEDGAYVEDVVSCF